MEKIRQENNWNIPNALTVLRLVLLPIFAWRYLIGDGRSALIVYLVVQLSDLLDGFIARRFHQITSFGKLMDPLADKLMLLTVLVCFGVGGKLSWWVIALVLGKEALMIAGGVFALHKKIVVSALWIGKVATGLFAAALIGMLINNQRPMLPGILLRGLLYAAVAVTLAAFGVYVRSLRRMLRSGKVKERAVGEQAKE